MDFDMYNPQGISDGLQVAWKRLQAPGVPDLVWTPHNGGHWIATRGNLIRQMFTDTEHFSSECPFIPREAGEEYDFIPTSMDPPEHRPYRAIISSVVSLPVVERLEGAITEIAGELIEGIRGRGQCNFTKDYAEPFPIRIFMKLVNLPHEDAPRLKYLSDQITRPDGSMSLGQATRHLYDYLSPIIDQRLQQPGDDAISAIVHGKVNGRAITKEEAERMCGLLLVGGLDTVVNFLSFVMQFLAGSPAHRKALIDRPEVIPAATEELLRRFSLVADGRIVKREIEVDGVLLKQGDMVLIPQLLTGLDERENACPMHVDFGREKITHTTFGYGPHHCAGAHLARLEVAVTLREWLARIPDFEVAPGAVISHQGGVVGAVKALPLVWNTDSTRVSPRRDYAA
ncbi:cytochrome P450 [Pandoraea terrae]|uniref:cytochrome P450 n=1 Tax=Pandoraea terrae TaxID=1537710 RepID=UPI00177CDD44|nr:cytochrome P450 [Pandoraea terrae]